MAICRANYNRPVEALAHSSIETSMKSYVNKPALKYNSNSLDSTAPAKSTRKSHVNSSCLQRVTESFRLGVLDKLNSAYESILGLYFFEVSFNHNISLGRENSWQCSILGTNLPATTIGTWHAWMHSQAKLQWQITWMLTLALKSAWMSSTTR